MRCFDLLDLPFLTDVKLIAGKEGLSNSIFWIQIAEAASDDKELYDLLKPGDFLLVKQPKTEEDPAHLAKICDFAIDKKLAGILLFVPKDEVSLPKEISDKMDQAKIALFALHGPTSLAIEIQYYMCHMVVAGNTSGSRTETIFRDLYFGTVENAELRIRRAEFMGYNLRRKHSGMVVLVTDAEGSAALPDRNLENLITSFLANYDNGKSLGIVHHHLLLSLIPWKGSTNASIKELAGQIVETLNEKYPEYTVYIGIGQGKEDCNLFRDSVNEALEIVKIMHMQKKTNEVRSYCDMYSFLLIFENKDNEKAVSLYNKIYQPLSEYDKNHSANLVVTLDTYLENNKNAVQTAKVLFLHRNTLLYQLKKIEELTGMKFNDPEDEFQLRMGYYLKIYIESESSMDRIMSEDN